MMTKRPPGRFILPGKRTELTVFRQKNTGNCEKSRINMPPPFSTHSCDAAIMLRLILLNVFGMILATGTVIHLHPGTAQANSELTEHCDFFEVTRCKFQLKPLRALAAV
ncbi:hypothetical protein ACN0IV_09595 [Trabulsiella odontotermitis]|uniref:hypothetical protein n=1 Tax=Trabulsiella odontotermitis TaxID=379893 RepID=UPI003AD102DB